METGQILLLVYLGIMVIFTVYLMASNHVFQNLDGLAGVTWCLFRIVYYFVMSMTWPAAILYGFALWIMRLKGVTDE